MKQLITIFKNLGTIVILLFQIGYVSIIDYIRPHDNAKNTKNKTTSDQYTPIRKIDLTKETVFVKHKPLYKRTRRHDKPKPKQSDTKNKTASHNTPPSKLGQAWISQLKTIYDK